MIAQKRKNKKKWLWWGAGLVIVAVIAIIGVIIWQNNQKNEQNNETEVVEMEKIEQKEEKNQNEQTESEKKDEEVAKQHEVTQYTGENPNTAQELSGAVTYAEVNRGVLMVRTNIDQYLTEGICELTLLRRGTIIYSDTTKIVGGASTATCQGFDISVAGLGEGNIEININLTAGGKSGVIRGEASI